VAILNYFISDDCNVRENMRKLILQSLKIKIRVKSLDTVKYYSTTSILLLSLSNNLLNNSSIRPVPEPEREDSLPPSDSPVSDSTASPSYIEEENDSDDSINPNSRVSLSPETMADKPLEELSEAQLRTLIEEADDMAEGSGLGFTEADKEF
jgi:hypothetical protein